MEPLLHAMHCAITENTATGKRLSLNLQPSRMALRPDGVWRTLEELVAHPRKRRPHPAEWPKSIYKEKYCCCLEMSTFFCSREIPRETWIIERSIPRVSSGWHTKMAISEGSHTNSLSLRDWTTTNICTSHLHIILELTITISDRGENSQIRYHQCISNPSVLLQLNVLFWFSS